MSVKRTSIDEMIEKVAERKLSRRQFNQLLGATGISLFAAPMFVRSAAAAGDDESVAVTELQNYCQIMTKVAEITGTLEVVDWATCRLAA